MAELHKWLVDVQAKLHITMQEVAKKIEETKPLPPKPAVVDDVGKPCAGDDEKTLRQAAQSTEPSVEAPAGFQRPVNANEQEGDLNDITAWQGKGSQYMPKVAQSTEPTVLSPSEKECIKTLPGKTDEQRSDLHDPSDRTALRDKASHATEPPAVSRGKSGTYEFKSESKQRAFLKNCLLRLLCYRRRPGTSKKGKNPTCNLAEPTELFEYSEAEHKKKTIGEQLQEMRKPKLVPFRMWEKRVQIKDATGKVYSLSQWTEGKNNFFKAVAVDVQDHEETHDPAKAVFPLRVFWRWLEPDEIPSITWKDNVWWSVTGLFNNQDLRAFSMKFHSRLVNIDQKVKKLSKGLVADKEKTIRCNTTMVEETDFWEMSLAIDTLTDFDDLLCLGFACDGHDRVINEVLESAGCSWETFFEAFMKDRNGALLEEGTERRTALVNAATKGADGLELLFQQLLDRIHQNDMMVFKLLLLLCNGVTCVAQFAWSDYLVPIIRPTTTTTTPVPTWQTQIADIFNSSSGR